MLLGSNHPMRRLPVVLALLLPVPALAAASGPSRFACGTARNFPAIRERASLVMPSDAPAAFGGLKTQRDPFGTLPNVRTSANFALKWGPSATYSEAIATAALASFEEGWTVEMGQMGHPVPDGSDTYLLNVYIGNSGGGAPDINFDGAYANVDNQGFPYIVMSPSIMEYFGIPGSEGYAATTAVHELYHTVQFATGSYLQEDAYWFWEATADWVAGEIYPDEDGSYAFVGAWALYPHVAIDFADYYDEGNVIELHQYGASIFPQFLTDVVADVVLIRDAWVSGGANGDPLSRLDALLGPQGTDIREAFADFAQRLPLWDYPRGAKYEAWADYYGDYYSDQDHRIAAEVGSKGTSGWDGAPSDTLPAAFGINVIRLTPVDKTIEVSVRAASEGSQGSAAATRAFVARRDGATKEYFALAFEGDTGSVEVDANADELFLVVVPLPASDMGVDETFDYDFRVDAGGGGGKGGTCSVGGLDGGASAIPLALLALSGLVLSRRRR